MLTFKIKHFQTQKVATRTNLMKISLASLHRLASLPSEGQIPKIWLAGNQPGIRRISLDPLAPGKALFYRFRLQHGFVSISVFFRFIMKITF